MPPRPAGSVAAMQTRSTLARLGFAFLAAVTLAACQRDDSAPEEVSAAPQLDAPTPDAEPSRQFTPLNDATRGVTGELDLSMVQRMPDAAEADRGAAPVDMLTLRGSSGLVVESEISNAIPPSTTLEGQTLRALLGLPVEVSQVLVYRVTEETKPQNGQGLCAADATSFLVVWEADAPGDGALKLLGVIGGAPGAAGARPCALLAYRRV